MRLHDLCFMRCEEPMGAEAHQQAGSDTCVVNVGLSEGTLTLFFCQGGWPAVQRWLDRVQAAVDAGRGCSREEADEKAYAEMLAREAAAEGVDEEAA